MVPDIDLLREALKDSILKDFTERKGGGSHGIRKDLSKNYFFEKVGATKVGGGGLRILDDVHSSSFNASLL